MSSSVSGAGSAGVLAQARPVPRSWLPSQENQNRAWAEQRPVPQNREEEVDPGVRAQLRRFQEQARFPAPRTALLDDSGQTNACCALLVTPTRGPERLEGCAQPPNQQERTRPEVAGSARHQAAATRSESVKSTDRGNI